jgi:hypothetical protein
MNDIRMPDGTKHIVEYKLVEFMSFSRKRSSIDRWALLKKLGKYELADVAMRVEELIFLY